MKHSQIKAFKWSALTIVFIAIVSAYYTFAKQYPHFKYSLICEACFITATVFFFWYKGNGVQKHLDAPRTFIFNFLISTSITFIAVYALRYYIAMFVVNIPYTNWFADTLYTKTLVLVSINNLLSLLHYLTFKEEEEKPVIAPVQIYETSRKEAELTKLRHQINPHFLFNSLNSINALMQFDKDRARNMIVNLSEYYRNIINANEHTWHSLDKELKDIQLYCNIEKIRFGHRLNLILDCSEDLAQYQVPALIFQPLVENAIKYGLYDTLGTIDIHIKLYPTQATSGKQFVTFQISNPFDHNTNSKPAGTGFGLENIKKRLYLLFATYNLFHTRVEKINEAQSLFYAYLSIPKTNTNTTNENKDLNN